MTLRGPADPEAFRRKDQWGRRWYYDNLPGCDVAPQWDDEAVSVTACKAAWEKEFTKRIDGGSTVKLDALRVAKFVWEHRGVLDLPKNTAIKTMAMSAGESLKDAGARGSDVHEILESLMTTGQMPTRPLGPPLRDDALTYREACEAFLNDWQPELIYTEVVGINRTLPYGGTADLYARINGKVCPIDWKSRDIESNHGAYDNEAAQVGGAYAHFDYLIVEEDGQARRVPMPELDCGLIVSLKPDGYQVYPVDLDLAWEAFQKMHEGYLLKLSGQSAGRRSIGTHWRPASPTSARPTSGHKPTLSEVRDRLAAVTPPKADPSPVVDEGEVLSDDEVDRLRAAFMDSGQVKRINGWLTEASQAGRGFNVAERATARRCQIIRAAIDWSDQPDDIVRAALHIVRPSSIHPAFTIGQVLGSLGLDQATRLRLLARQLDEGVAALTFAEDGSAVLAITPQPAA